MQVQVELAEGYLWLGTESGHGERGVGLVDQGLQVLLGHLEGFRLAAGRAQQILVGILALEVVVSEVDGRVDPSPRGEQLLARCGGILGVVIGTAVLLVVVVRHCKPVVLQRRGRKRKDKLKKRKEKLLRVWL